MSSVLIDVHRVTKGYPSRLGRQVVPCVTQRVPIQAVDQQQAGPRLAQPDEQRRQC